MQDFVSTHWVRGAGTLASLSIAWIAFVPVAFPWLVAGWACVIWGTVLLLHARPTWSLREMIDEGEADRRPAVVPGLAAARRTPKVVPRR